MNISVLAIYVGVASSAYLSAQKVFVALSTLNCFTTPVAIVPFAMAGVAQVCYTSMQHIKADLSSYKPPQYFF